MRNDTAVDSLFAPVVTVIVCTYRRPEKLAVCLAALDRQTVRVNLTLVDDSALGQVVLALGELGSHIVALQKSEPSLEDVFVELVGRGFQDEEAATGADTRPPAPPWSTA